MREGIIVALVLLVGGAVRVVPQLVEGGPWTAEPTVAAIVMTFGLLALVIELWPLRHRRTS
ncbi:MAG TPA: hypothetical protein VM734_14275 [Kofleriaceae bacterium]|jgi:hypothetical protein|nr:hypothetical protein [Gaiellales bacterium]HVK74493.1 hypothetical protein [Kofleriaceae bacterium]